MNDAFTEIRLPLKIPMLIPSMNAVRMQSLGIPVSDSLAYLRFRLLTIVKSTVFSEKSIRLLDQVSIVIFLSWYRVNYLRQYVLCNQRLGLTSDETSA